MLSMPIALSISAQQQPCRSWYYSKGLVSMCSYKAMNCVCVIL